MPRSTSVSDLAWRSGVCRWGWWVYGWYNKLRKFVHSRYKGKLGEGNDKEFDVHTCGHVVNGSVAMTAYGVLLLHISRHT